jgi:hypothetical protein
MTGSRHCRRVEGGQGRRHIAMLRERAAQYPVKIGRAFATGKARDDLST